MDGETDSSGLAGAAATGTARAGPARTGTAPVEVSVVDRSGGAAGGPAALRRWLERVVAELSPAGGSLAVLLAGDEELAELNERYRGRSGPTDVLSFPGDAATPGEPGALPAGDGGEPLHLGDVAISVPSAARQARDADHDLARELRLLALHGLLHCLGHDHETDGGAMERLERRLRRRWLDADV